MTNTQPQTTAITPNPHLIKGAKVTVNNHPAHLGEVIDRRGLIVTVRMANGDVLTLGHHEVTAR